jgi:phosphate transport system ATP-binding protein
MSEQNSNHNPQMATNTQSTTESAVENDTPSIQTPASESNDRIRDEWTDYRFDDRTAIETENLNVHYGDDHAIRDVSIDIPAESVTALIGSPRR